MADFDLQPDVLNLTGYVRGDAIRLPFTVQQDITGWTIRSHLRQNYDDANPAAVFSVVERNSTAGQFSLVLTSTQTATLAGKYFWDIEGPHSSRGPVTFLKGSISFDKDATR